MPKTNSMSGSGAHDIFDYGFTQLKNLFDYWLVLYLMDALKIQLITWQKTKTKQMWEVFNQVEVVSNNIYGFKTWRHSTLIAKKQLLLGKLAVRFEVSLLW